MFRTSNLVLSAALIFGAFPRAGDMPAPPRNPDLAVFVNELHYDNAGTDSGEAIEIAGPAGTDLAGWSIILYNGSGGAVYTTTALSGLIPDQMAGYGTLAFSYPSNGIQNGSPDGLALVDPSNAVLQFLSYEGTFTAVGGPADGLQSADIGVSEAGSEPIGQSLQLSGAGTSYEHFTWSGPAASTFGSVNTGQTFAVITNAPVIADCGPALTAVEGLGATQSIHASDSDGVVVDISLTSVEPTTGGITLTNLAASPGAGETATADLVIDPSVGPGSYTALVTATNSDPTPRTGTCSLAVTIVEILPIGAVQGSVGDADNGLIFRSPYAPASGNGAGATVAVRGVIYQTLLARTASGGSTYGFFLQDTASTADGDPSTSDGIFVFTSGFTDLIGGYVPVVGDEVVVQGRVSEFFSLTELSSASALQVVRSGVDLSAEVAPFEVNPPDDLSEANRYWERREGMRAVVPAGSLVLNGRNVFPSTLDGEVWLVRGDHPLAGRAEEYERRSFRDPHPLDNDPALFDDGNGYRIILGSLGIKAAFGDNAALIAPARTFDTLTHAPTGGVYFSFSKYQIQVGEQLALDPGADPSGNAPPPAFDPATEVRVVTFNLENLYDFRDDPFDGCDFTGNAGCPGVNPPFDYVPASEAAYQARLAEIASQIVDVLSSPDVLLVQEIEDQDICTAGSGALTCAGANDADGLPDPLQELAAAIGAAGGPTYESAYDRDGADDRGIVSAFLYRADRVELLDMPADDPVLGSAPTVEYRGTPAAYNADAQNPKVLNAVLPADVDRSTGTDGNNVFTRPPQVGLFRLWRGGVGAGVFQDAYLISNHFSSTPDARVGQRTEQAAYNAAIVAALQAADPDARVVLGGDLNVYPRPDDPFAPGHPLHPSDQLGPLYEQGLTNLFDILVVESPASAYSYVFQGQAQTLDQLFFTPSQGADLARVAAAHVNSDWPSDAAGDGARGTSDHDPIVADFSLMPTLDRLEQLTLFYAEAGMIQGNNTLEILLSRLARARGHLAAGRQAAYLAQLRAFANQVLGFTPQFISEVAGHALAEEAKLLVSSGP